MRYAVVRFLADGSVSEVPSKWLASGNTECWWPPSKNVTPFIKGNIDTKSNWMKFEVVVETFCDSLKMARKKAGDINYIESEEDSKGRGKRISKQKVLTDDDGTDSDETDFNKRRFLKPPPALDMEIGESSKESASSFKMIDNQDILNAEFLLINTPTSSDTTFNSTITLNTEHAVGENRTLESSEYVIQNQRSEITESQASDSGCVKCHDMLTTVKQTRRMLIELKLQCEEFFSNAKSNSDVGQFSVIAKQIPLQSLEALDAFDEELAQNSASRLLLKQYLTTIGGVGVKDIIYRMMGKLIGNELGVSCSWLGQRGNNKIAERPSVNVAKGVAVTIHNISEKEFETITAEWLRHAKQRLTREKKK